MTTITLTMDEYSRAQKPFNPEDTVIIVDTGAAISGLPSNEFSSFAANNVDFLDASDNLLFISTKEYENLLTVGLAENDYVVLSDLGKSIGGGTVEEISSLAIKGVDLIDATDDAISYSVAQYRAVGPVALASNDYFTLADRGEALSSLTVAEIANLSIKGVDIMDATDGAITFSFAQYAALGSFPISPGDRLTINGSSHSDKIFSRASSDTIKGFRGNDRLYGEAGDDKIYGGLGRDYLKGGAGRDAFVFDTKVSKAYMDRVMDFNVKDDVVWLDNAIFKSLGKKGSTDSPYRLNKKFFQIGSEADDRDDYILYNRKTGVLSYDKDGSGASKAVEIAKLDKSLKLNYKDFFIV